MNNLQKYKEGISMNNLQKYIDTIYGLLSRIATEEEENINLAADYMAEYLGKDETHLLHIIGTGKHGADIFSLSLIEQLNRCAIDASYFIFRHKTSLFQEQIPISNRQITKKIKPKNVVRKVSGRPGANRREARKLGLLRMQKFRSRTQV